MRRKAAVTVLAVMVAFASWGCSAAQWFQLIGKLLPLAGDVAAQFYKFSNHGTIDPDDRAAIQNYTSNAQAILEAISALVSSVQNAGDVTAVQKISALLASLNSQSASLLAALHVKDENTVAFIQTMIADAHDLIALLPIVQTPSPGAAQTHAAVMSMTIRVPLPKAKSLENVFKARLDSLPKSSNAQF